MPARTTLSATDYVTVISAATLAKGNITSGSLDLSTGYNAWFFIRIGRGGTSAIATGVYVKIRRTLNANTLGHPKSGDEYGTGTTTASSTTVSVDSASGQKNITVASVSGFSANDLICVQNASGGFTRLEWHRIAKITGSVITVDRNLTYTHTAVQADTVRNQADIFIPVKLEGGATYEVILDYASETTGDDLTVEVLAQTYDHDDTTTF